MIVFTSGSICWSSMQKQFVWYKHFFVFFHFKKCSSSKNCKNRGEVWLQSWVSVFWKTFDGDFDFLVSKKENPVEPCVKNWLTGMYDEEPSYCFYISSLSQEKENAIFNTLLLPIMNQTLKLESLPLYRAFSYLSCMKSSKTIFTKSTSWLNASG